MKKTIFINDVRGFIKEFSDFGLFYSFTYDGYAALFTYFKELDDDLEVDALFIACNFTQFDNLEDFRSSYGTEKYPTMESIEQNTDVIMVDSESFIVHNF